MPLATVLAALCAAAAVVLLISGAAKIVRPQPAALMLAELARAAAPRLPRRLSLLRPVGRVVGVIELGVGVGVLVAGGRLATALLAVTYLVVGAVALRLATGGRPVACGCFGRDDTPVGAAHVVVTAMAAGLAVAGTVIGIPAGAGLLDSGVMTTIGGGILVVVLAALSYLTMTALPALSSSRRLVEAS